MKKHFQPQIDCRTCTAHDTFTFCLIETFLRCSKNIKCCSVCKCSSIIKCAVHAEYCKYKRSVRQNKKLFPSWAFLASFHQWNAVVCLVYQHNGWWSFTFLRRPVTMMKRSQMEIVILLYYFNENFINRFPQEIRQTE